MVVTCAFYGFANRTTKINLEIEGERLEVGEVVTFDGDNYVILSVFEVDGLYYANVVLEHIYRARARIPSKRISSSTTPSSRLVMRQHHEADAGHGTTLHNRLQAAETTIEHLLRERDEALKLLDRAMQELDRLEHSAGTQDRSMNYRYQRDQ